MRAAGVHELAVAAFGRNFDSLSAGEDTGVIRESEIDPVGQLPGIDELPFDKAAAAAALGQTVIIKLNGGLGTSMGLAKAKSLLPVKDGLSFLDITARQVLALHLRAAVPVPLVLMNSTHTREDSLAALERYPELSGVLPADFLQSLEPKLRVEDLQPVSWPRDPELEWCPPGHGDLYVSLVSSGLLHELLERGYRYAFVSNIDNLGGTVNERVLGWMATEGIRFVSEQCRRTAGDRKGGHLARRRDTGRLVLRETAQTSAKDQAAMQDADRHPYFNVNNLTIDLTALEEVMAVRGNVLSLPLIRNAKTVDPSDSESPAVYQLETAMGAAISEFDGAQAVRVPRSRFVPVKTTDDLLAVRSDCFELTEYSELVVASDRRLGPIFISLDPRFYKYLADFDARFPHGPPSLVGCERLVVGRDVTFGARVIARGAVDLTGPGPTQLQLPDDTVLGPQPGA